MKKSKTKNKIQVKKGGSSVRLGNIFDKHVKFEFEDKGVGLLPGYYILRRLIAVIAAGSVELISILCHDFLQDHLCVGVSRLV